jgi:hypothetical protein
VKQQWQKPKEGDRAQLRGREASGQLARITEMKWCRVMWDKGCDGPRLVHLQELEKVDG